MARIEEYASELLTRTGLLMLAGASLLIAGLIVPSQSVTVYLGFIALFTAFDVFGFTRTDGKRGSAAYRLCQWMFHVAITALVVAWKGPVVAVACTIAWLSLVCDVLFYWAESLPLDNFSWFRLSPVIAFYTYALKRPETPALAVKVSALVGFTLGLLLIIVF